MHLSKFWPKKVLKDCIRKCNALSDLYTFCCFCKLTVHCSGLSSGVVGIAITNGKQNCEELKMKILICKEKLILVHIENQVSTTIATKLSRLLSRKLKAQMLCLPLNPWLLVLLPVPLSCWPPTLFGPSM